MHYACLGGHAEAVQLLLECKGDVTLKNTYDHSPLDLAIDNLHHDVAVAMLRCKTSVHSVESTGPAAGHCCSR